MVEKLQDIIKKGWSIWRKNLILSVPFILSIVLIIILVIVFGIAIALLAFSGLADFSGMNMLNAVILALATVLFIILVSLISSFFSAGAIGMSKKAIEQKKPNLDEMTDYGKRKFMDLFLASLIIMVITLVSLILLAGVFIGIPLAFGFSPSDSMVSFIPMIVGAAISILVLIVIGLALAMVPYAVVISDLGPMEGVRKGARFFLDNRLHTFLLWLIVMVISIGSSAIFNVIQFIFEQIPLLGIILSITITLISVAFSTVVLAPLSTVWYSHFYMDRVK